MKVGLILECGRDGADERVCKILIEKLAPGTEVSCATMGGKKKLIPGCGEAARILLEDEGCDRVVILWDLHPAWQPHSKKACRHNDKEEIFASLAEAKVPFDRVFLVCAEKMMEAWLLADERAISAAVSTPSRVRRVTRIRFPERELDPKSALMRIFSQHGRAYNEVIDAARIASYIDSWNRLRNCESFTRFALKSVGLEL